MTLANENSVYSDKLKKNNKTRDIFYFNTAIYRVLQGRSNMTFDFNKILKK